MGPLTYLCPFCDEDFKIDGDLSKAVWELAPWSDRFVDIEGDVGPIPPLSTRLKMLWSANCLYIGAELEEPHLWATLTETDSVIFQDNDFEVFIDPDDDSHNYVELEVNALNTKWDLLLPRPYKDRGLPLTGWRIRGLKTAVRLEGTLNDASDLDRGWSLEMAIPFAALAEISRRHCPPQSGEYWRINFSRVQWDLKITEGGQYSKIPGSAEHNWVWSPQGIIDMHRPEMWGYLRFCRPGFPVPVISESEMEARRRLHAVYYAQSDFRKKHGRWAHSTLELQIGDPEIILLTTPSLYEAVLGATSGREWHISQDGLVWEQGSSTDNLAG